MSKSLFISIAFIFISTLFICSPLKAENTIKKIVFGDNLDVAIEKAKENNLPIILYFKNANCKHCEMMDKFWKKESLDKYENRFIFVSIDTDENAKIATDYQVEGTPHLFLLSPKAEKITSVLGGLEQQELEDILAKWSLYNLDQTKELEEEKKNDNDYTKIDWSLEGYRGHGICFQNVGYGPLRIATQSPFQSLRYTFQPRIPNTLHKGQFELHLQDTWANIWSRSGDEYLMDFETNATSFHIAYGLTNSFQIEVQYETRSRFGGAMDSFIQGFHDLFGIDQNGRKDVPRNEVSIQFSEANGFPEINLEGDRRKGLFYHNLSATFQHTITCGNKNRPALSYAITIGQNIYNKDELHGKIPLDVSTSFSASQRFKNFYFYGAIGVSVFGNNKIDTDAGVITLRRLQLSTLTAIEWRFRNKMSVSFQYLVTQGAISNRHPFNRFSHEVTLGFSWEIRNNLLLQVGMIENMFVHDNSPDFGVFSAITIRL